MYNQKKSEQTGLFGREALKRGTEKVGIRTEVAGGVVFCFCFFYIM